MYLHLLIQDYSYVANKDVTLQQLKLEIIGSVTDTLITSASPALVMKKIQGLVF